jgi:broad specificity phosphatase PhoE
VYKFNGYDNQEQKEYMQTMSIYLIRHAEPLSSLLSEQDCHPLDQHNYLTPSGLQQAEALGQFFQKRLKQASCMLYASPLVRAAETAQEIGHWLAIAPQVEPALAERDFLAGRELTCQQVQQAQILAYKNCAQSIEGGESIVAHRQRVQHWFAQFRAEVMAQPEVDYLIVSHGGTMEHLLACMFDAPQDSLHKYFFACPCAHFHQITPFFPEPNWLVWRLEAISASAKPALSL